jgi:hypothetical protein
MYNATRASPVAWEEAPEPSACGRQSKGPGKKAKASLQQPLIPDKLEQKRGRENERRRVKRTSVCGGTNKCRGTKCQQLHVGAGGH